MNPMIKMTLPICLIVQLTACGESGSDSMLNNQAIESTPQLSKQGLSETSPLGNVEKTANTVLQKTKGAGFIDPASSIKPPQRISFQIIDDKQSITWDAVEGASEYNLYGGGTHVSDFRIISTIFTQEPLEYSLNEIVGDEVTNIYITTVSYGVESVPSVITSLSANQVAKQEDIVPF
ncbi:MAG: Unknown protein [uncultured Thiotrichaceae bacterium]|uniref:Fibronectin type-III domain-containing protein n=1 Tax=uncultured Thiotrichaceae bacterium TaxID=298394 RepID=A0A6S6TWE8_9GAMM|nr:MAG: Unknown protein [uncultured Thiotrichaceae bacterium]